ncbi:DPY27 [Hepatospora eriocheir]|nr:DPY27 [Hepatospora eriocheir]
MTSQSLQIEYVTLKDFKSYKGEYRIGPFDKHFTAIVGPNGSGKSNIIDGILFVLGYKAKKMRNSSISALINHECTSCSVTI